MVDSPGPAILAAPERETLRLVADCLAPGAREPVPLPSASERGVLEQLERVVTEYMGGAQRDDFRRLLRTLESPLANLLLSGRPSRFHTLSSEDREKFLLDWADSRIAAKRQGFQAIKRLTLFLYYASARAAPADPVADALAYRIDDRDRPEWTSGPEPMVHPTPPPDSGEVETEVCVVGSGAGGAVVAAHLAAQGHRVVVLEAGPFQSAGTFPQTESDSVDQQSERHGLLGTKDLSFQILAGRVAGGSTTMNWMTCLPPPAVVRREWEEGHGIAGVAGPEFDRCLSSVTERLGVGADESVRNGPNDALWRGCRALGYTEGRDYEVIPRNARGCDGRCTLCTFGCPFDAKQSALNTYLADALRHGARLFCDVPADHLLVAHGRVVGVVARPSGRSPRTLFVRARAVVLAGGAIQSPALLLRSGIQAPGVGENLHLHPTTAVFSEFSQPVRLWSGPMQTVVVRRLQDSAAGLHGPWLESAPAHPGLAALGLPWMGARRHREEMQRIAYAAATIALVRDVGGGSVRVDRHGQPVINYELSGSDRRHIIDGLIEAARINLAAGAVRVSTLHQAGCDIRQGSRIEEFASRLARLGIVENDLVLFSAHPTGTLRLGDADPRSVARSTGETWAVENLYVADGSALPTAPGVNPMLSIMAMALRTAQHVDSRLQAHSL